jgi:hypothetical protein
LLLCRLAVLYLLSGLLSVLLGTMALSTLEKISWIFRNHVVLCCCAGW